MEFDKSPNLKYQAVTINSAKENCGNPQKFYIELIKVLFLQKKNRFDNDYQSGWHAKRDSNPYYPKSFSMLSAILLAVIITQAFRIRRLKKEIIKRDTADEFCRQWYWREENKTQKQRQPQNKRKSLLSFLRSFL